MRKLNIAFVCVHNSCRSQMAEAICKEFYSEYFNGFSAGTHLKSEINPDAVATVKRLYGVDMSLTQRSKLVEELPKLDIVVTMGCNVDCPYLECLYRTDFGLRDPSGLEDYAFELTCELIRCKLDNLLLEIELGKISV